MLRRALIILAIAAGHFTITIVLFGIVYARGMEAFDSGAAPTPFDSIVGRIAQVLLFPFLPLAERIQVQSGSSAEWALFFGNSFLWAGVLYSIFAFVRHHRRARESKSAVII